MATFFFILSLFLLGISYSGQLVETARPDQNMVQNYKLANFQASKSGGGDVEILLLIMKIVIIVCVNEEKNTFFCGEK